MRGRWFQEFSDAKFVQPSCVTTEMRMCIKGEKKQFNYTSVVQNISISDKNFLSIFVGVCLTGLSNLVSITYLVVNDCTF